MHKNGRKNLNIQDEYIHIRVSKRTKSCLEKQAENKGMNLSDYIRHLLKEGNRREKNNKRSAECIVLCQEIVEYVKEKYDCADNEILERMVDKAWEKLS